MKKSTIAVSLLLLGNLAMNAKIHEQSPLEKVSTYAELSLESPQLRNAQQSKALLNASAASFSESNYTPDDIIFDTPEGEELMYMRSGMSYLVFWGSLLNLPVEGLAGEAVRGNDGSFYFKDVVMNLATNSYIKGTELENGDIEIQLPQPTYYSNTDEGTIMFYTTVLELKQLEEGYITYTPVEENNTCRFVKNEDGDLELTFDGDGQYILGVATSDGEWAGYGNQSEVYSLFNYTLATPPASLKTEKWALVSDGNGQFVQVGVDENDMWIQGISSIHPEAWIKGEINGDKVVFPSPQYTGTFDNYPYFYFFVAAEAEPNPDSSAHYDFVSIDDLEFTYDAEKKYMKSENAAVISNALNWVNPLESHVAPSITFQPEEVSLVPADPTILDFGEYMDGTCYLEFMQPMTNIYGQIINPANMYYSIYLNEELFVFEAEEYDLEEDMTEIPYEYSDYFTIACDGSLHSIDFELMGIEVYGVQSIYRDGEQVYKSNIVSTKSTSVNNISKEKPINTMYVDLTGRKISNPDKGIFIRIEKYADGSTKSFKVVK